MQPVIRFENVGKLYRLGTVGTGTLSHDLRRWWITSVMRREDPYLKIGETNDRSTKGSSDYVYALRDINLEVNEGDVLGIIGKNGAGKSTLLKLLSRVTAPTTGKIYTRGRIASLLEVGTGFHPELTGRENIYMNGCILGMKRHEIDKKLDEIVDFSGCERYIDTPVKRYSSGMMVRLGFAVAAHLDPEILVVDEVLAVGDAEFQKKAIGKMQDVSKGQGRTVLFVSHNMDSIRSLCSRGILLGNGIITFNGDITEAIDLYLDSSFHKSLITQNNLEKAIRWKNHKYSAEFLSFNLQKKDAIFASNENIVIHIKVLAHEDIHECRICNTIRAKGDIAVCNCTSEDTFSLYKGEIKTIEYTLINPGLVKGFYTISFSIGTGSIFTGEYNYDIVKDAISFYIDKPYYNENKYYVQWDSKVFGHILSKTSSKIIEQNTEQTIVNNG